MGELYANMCLENAMYKLYPNVVELYHWWYSHLVDRDEQAEAKTAYHLFTGNTDGPITIFDLKRIARQLKENVTDGQLEDMLLEASGKMTVNQYVNSWTTPNNQTKHHSLQLLICNIRGEFEEIMKRAGML